MAKLDYRVVRGSFDTAYQLRYRFLAVNLTGCDESRTLGAFVRGQK
jgi:hypothetical protein